MLPGIRKIIRYSLAHQPLFSLASRNKVLPKKKANSLYMYLQDVQGENLQKIHEDVNQQLADIQLFFDQLEQRGTPILQQKVKQVIDKARIKAQQQQQVKSTSMSEYHQTFLFYQLENLLKINDLDDLVADLQKVNYSLVSEDYLEDKNNVHVEEQLIHTTGQLKKFSHFAISSTPQDQPLFEKLKLKHNQTYSFEEDQKVFTKLRDIDLHSFRQSSPQDNYFKDIDINIAPDLGGTLEDDIILDDEVTAPRTLELQVGTFLDEEEAAETPHDYHVSRHTLSDKKIRQNQELLDSNAGESIRQKQQLQKFVDIKMIKTQMVYQEGFEQSQIESSNWVYAFNFPFNIKQKQAFLEKFMGQLEEYAGEINQIVVYEESELFQDYKMTKYL